MQGNCKHSKRIWRSVFLQNLIVWDFIFNTFILCKKDERRADIDNTKRDITEVQDLLNEMSLKNDYSNHGWDSTIDEIEDEIAQWKQQLQAV